MSRVVGYYVHHHGSGHLHRFLAVRDRLPNVVGLSSLGRPPGLAEDEWLQLAPDTDDAVAADPTAGGALHWAPLGVDGLRERTAQLTGWIAAARPCAVVVDVSVEVALTVRLCSVPTVVVAQHGDRGDDAHRLAYRSAAAVAALWAEGSGPQVAGADPGRVHHVGPLSRFDDRLPSEAANPARADERRVVLLAGSGGSDWTRGGVDAARRATPDWSWQLVGTAAGGDALDASGVWDALRSADVVVAPASMNCVAEAAAGGCRLVVLPQARPFAEQHAHAGVLDSLGLAAVLPAWPEAAVWPSLLESVVSRPAPDWSRYHDGRAADRLAEVVEQVSLR